ncbi:hypothetical protein Acr_00g0055490 [Actinidia rufa]|uniref:Plant regulator RWP-RK family protein n=1 Tax=Actinidia rufa TaxID=165716 RepID=A0A7J0DLX5_9ERIC|nr:hypothetical protein Acr_00g0055490 [Actinidia rufa]
MNNNNAHQYAFLEIRWVLDRVRGIYKLPLALTWVPCGACKALLLVEDGGMLKDCDGLITDLHKFTSGRLGHHLRNGIGAVGRVLSSPNLLYCSDVTQLSMVEYPLAHFARENLYAHHQQRRRSAQLIEQDIGNNERSKILETMKEIKNFTLASGEVLGKELSVEVIEFQNGQKYHVQTLNVTGSLPSLEPLQNGGEIVQVDSSNHQSSDVEQCEIDGNHPQELGTKKTSGREHKNIGVIIDIPYEDILHYSKLSRCDAARYLQVSISTFKRVCRKYGISRWPPRNVDKVHPPRPSHVDHQEVTQLNSNLTSNQASASIAHTQPHDTVMQNANTVNVKAKYVKGLTVLFPLSLSSTLEELYECIETRLHLSRATYHACYIDGDNDKITITCDQDLQFWLCNSPRLPGSNAVVLHIDPISQAYHTKSVTPLPYIDWFPASLRPYILHVKDVALDGNCGFRAIAGLMGIGEDGWVQVRRDLLTELNSHVDDYKIMYGQQRINELTHCLSWFDGRSGMDRWMTMPDMGHLIASYYNVVLYLLSHQQCLTFLPLRSVPIPAASRREIAIGFGEQPFCGGIFVVRSPCASGSEQLDAVRYQCAQGWETTYNRRIQHFRELVDYHVTTTDAISLD